MHTSAPPLLRQLPFDPPRTPDEKRSTLPLPTHSAKAYEYRHVVCFEDTNVVGNVYYASYVAWQGRVREMFLKEHAPQILGDLHHGLVLATLSVGCDYYHELLPFDEVLIELRLGALAGSRMTLEFDYWKTSGAAPVLVAKGRQRIGCLRRIGDTVRAEPIPDYFEAALEPYRCTRDAPAPVELE